MKLFSGSASTILAEHIAGKLGIVPSELELTIFPDGERRLRVLETVVNEDVVVVQSTGMPTETHYMELFFIIDAIKRSGAASITCVIPYMGYQRQDHVFREGEARSLEVIVRFLESVGATRVIIVDPHSIKIPELFHIPVTDLSALSVFAKRIQHEGWNKENAVLVTPDMGGIRRIKMLSDMLDGMPFAAVEKNRDLATGDIESSIMEGQAKDRAIIVDDMISSGNTIIAAAELLKGQGAKEILVFATHPVFSAQAPQILQASIVEKVYVTDSIPVDTEKHFQKLEVISIAPVIAEAIKKSL